MNPRVWIVPAVILLALLGLEDIRDAGFLVSRAAAQSPAKSEDIFLPLAAQQVFTLSRVPPVGARCWVFENGSLELAGLDYTIVGNTLTFTGQTIEAGQVIQVQYW